MVPGLGPWGGGRVGALVGAGRGQCVGSGGAWALARVGAWVGVRHGRGRGPGRGGGLGDDVAACDGGTDTAAGLRFIFSRELKAMTHLGQHTCQYHAQYRHSTWGWCTVYTTQRSEASWSSVQMRLSVCLSQTFANFSQSILRNE